MSAVGLLSRDVDTTQGVSFALHLGHRRTTSSPSSVVQSPAVHIDLPDGVVSHVGSKTIIGVVGNVQPMLVSSDVVFHSYASFPGVTVAADDGAVSFSGPCRRSRAGCCCAGVDAAQSERSWRCCSLGCSCVACHNSDRCARKGLDRSPG